MTNLNLLSPQQKEILRSRVLYAMIERLLIFVMVAWLIATTALLGIKIQLTQNLTHTVSRQILTKEYLTANAQTKKLNDLIGRIAGVQRQSYPASDLITDVAARTPSGIMLSGIDFDLKSKSMNINGTAAERSGLLLFQDNLGKSPYLKSVQSPISNLFLKKDIVFQLQAIVDTDKLMKAYDPDSL